MGSGLRDVRITYIIHNTYTRVSVVQLLIMELEVIYPPSYTFDHRISETRFVLIALSCVAIVIMNATVSIIIIKVMYDNVFVN